MLVWVGALLCLVGLPVAAYKAAKQLPFGKVLGPAAAVAALAFWVINLERMQKHHDVIIKEIEVLGILIVVAVVLYAVRSAMDKKKKTAKHPAAKTQQVTVQATVKKSQESVKAEEKPRTTSENEKARMVSQINSTVLSMSPDAITDESGKETLQTKETTMEKELIIKSSKTEEPNVVLLTITVSKEDVEIYLQKVYRKNVRNYIIPGYREGKAPRKIIEKIYGNNVFVEEALNMLVPEVIGEVNNTINLLAIGEVEPLQAGNGIDFIFTIKAVTELDVALGQYKGLTYQKKDIVVTDEEIDDEIQKDLKKDSTTRRVDRQARSGDQIVLDFKGYVDGRAFEGGEGYDYPLILGSNTFIPGFEEQLIGVKASESTYVNVVFPKDYHSEDLKGKAAIFECTIHSVNEIVIPKADDEFANSRGFESFVTYKEKVKDALQEKKREEAIEDTNQTIIDKAVDNAVMHVPEMLIDDVSALKWDEFEQNLKNQGLSVEQYFEFLGKTQEELMTELRSVALHDIRTRFTLLAIAQKENIIVTEDEMKKEVEQISKNYGLSVEDTMHAISMDELKDGLLRYKAVNLVINSAAVELE